jgi:hypothetical protein
MKTKATDWDLTEVDENPRIAAPWDDTTLELNDKEMGHRYPDWETAWVGWYNIGLDKGVYVAICTADLARCEGEPCREPRFQVSHPNEARCRDLIEKHIIRQCRKVDKLKYKAPRICPF